MKDIQRLTGITEEQWSQLVFDYGLEFLETLMQSQQWVDAVSKTKSYWSWWRNQWEIIDLRFVGTWGQFNPTAGGMARLKTEYQRIHSPEAMHVFPGKNVIAEALPGFKTMLGSAMDQILREVEK
jgi:hypothetical protein